MALDPNEKRINPEDELFWKKVREAYDQAVTEVGQTITVQVGNKEATVHNTDGYKGQPISIKIYEVVNDPPTLVVP